MSWYNMYQPDSFFIMKEQVPHCLKPLPIKTFLFYDDFVKLREMVKKCLIINYQKISYGVAR